MAPEREDQGWVHPPGKLMVAGEYSVLTPGGRSLSFALSSSLSVKMAPSAVDLLTSEGLGCVDLATQSEGPTRFVWAALEECRQAGGEDLRWHVTIRGGLRLGGHKVGIGSSASVVVGVICAWNEATGSLLCETTLFRRAMWAHYRAQGKLGSGYDVATSLRGGVLEYQPPSTEWLEGERDRSRDSCDMSMNSMGWPAGLSWGAGFSGEGVSTRKLVESARAFQSSEMESLKQATSDAVNAWRGGSLGDLLPALAALDPALETWSRASELNLFTPRLQKMRGIAGEHGVVSRVSGAGGGDSMLLFSDRAEALEAVLMAWEAAGFHRLPFSLCKEGALPKPLPTIP